MAEILNPKRYDLEERTLTFARGMIEFTTLLPKTIQNVEVIKQAVRSAGSVGANYIEANESLSRKDFLLRVKICRKEAKETCYWLNPFTDVGAEVESRRIVLLQEGTELMKIFGSIVEKTQSQLV